MAGAPSLEQALAEFATIIVPLGQELGGPMASATALALAGPITSFFGVLALNFLGFTLLRWGLPTVLHALRCGVEYLSCVMHPSPRRAYRIHRHIARHSIEAKRGTGYHARRPRASDTSSGFESWEDFAERWKTGELTGDSTTTMDDTFTIRDVSRLTTAPEMRSAYMHLLTMYHTERPTQEFASGTEELQNAPVHVQQTYETLTERLFRTP